MSINKRVVQKGDIVPDIERSGSELKIHFSRLIGGLEFYKILHGSASEF